MLLVLNALALFALVLVLKFNGSGSLRSNLINSNVTNNKTVETAWLDYPGLVAHAGGAVCEKDYNTFYTNSLEALEQNYELGHRIFEFDFYLTSDNQLALVHDWEEFGYGTGQAMTLEEWQAFRPSGVPKTDSTFTSLTIDDIFEQMLEKKDMYLVTDTKLVEVSDEMFLQFQIIYNKAYYKNPDLLNRLIIQIYNEEMYNLVKSIYDFPNIIYTLYATESTSSEVLDFVSDKVDIKAIASPEVHPHGHLTKKDFIDSLHQMGKKVFVHTINSYDDLVKFSALGVDGVYTDLLLPRDIELYQIYSNP